MLNSIIRFIDRDEEIARMESLASKRAVGALRTRPAPALSARTQAASPIRVLFAPEVAPGTCPPNDILLLTARDLLA